MRNSFKSSGGGAVYNIPPGVEIGGGRKGPRPSPSTDSDGDTSTNFACGG